jgi:hypothetical protein
LQKPKFWIDFSRNWRFIEEVKGPQKTALRVEFAEHSVIEKISVLALDKYILPKKIILDLT